MSLIPSRRQFLVGSAALMAASTVGLRAAIAQDARLRLLFWGGQARADRTYGVSDLYLTGNPGLTIDGEFLAWNDYWPKLATQAAGGNAPDIVQMDYRYIVEYAVRGAIAPLDDFVGNALALADFDQDQIDGGKVGGKLYGISLGANSVAMAVNTAAFAEVGIEPPTATTTYDDIMVMGEAFNAANIRDGMKVIQDASGAEPALENWLRQKGKALYTAEGALAFDAADMTEWFTLWATMRDAGICNVAEDQALATGALEQMMISQGKSALNFANSNELVAYQAINQDPLTITSFPRIAADVGGGHYRKPSQFFSISGTSQQQEAAAKFISFFVNDQAAAQLLGVERGIPCSAAVRDALAPTLDEQSQIALNFVANLGDLVGPIPPSPPAAAGEVGTALLTKSQEVAFASQSPADAGPAFIELANQILARAS